MTKSTGNLAAKTKPATAGSSTKKDLLIKLLGAKSGADLKALSEKLGWKQHTTRAAMSGLRKAGFEIVGERPAKGGNSKYRILSTPAANGNPEVVVSHAP